MNFASIVQCPACHGHVAVQDDVFVCEGCGKQYEVRGGIPCFAEPDPFYDHYADVHCPFTETPKGVKAAILRAIPFWSYREWRFWRDAIPHGGRLLDIGAGRGKEIFIERASETVGLDGSLAFLTGCIEHYDAAVLASLPRLPFADGTFDVVASSHVLGHIPLGDKEELVGEIARVLRPGGVTAHIIETDSENSIIRAAKAQPELYRKWLIEQDGHVGLELADTVVDRFARHGLALRLERYVDAVIPSVMYYKKHLEHPGYENLPHVGWTRALDRLNRSSHVGNLAYEVGLGTFHRTAEQWFGRPNTGNFIHVAFEKTGATG